MRNQFPGNKSKPEKLLRCLTTAVGFSVWEHCFHHMGYSQGAEKQDVAPALIFSDFLIFSYCNQSSEGMRKTEFSLSGESCRSLCPLEQGEGTLRGLDRNPVTKSLGNFKTSVFKVLVISSIVIDRTKSYLLKAVGCSRGPRGGNREDVKQADFPGMLWAACRCCMYTYEQAVAGQETLWDLTEESRNGKWEINFKWKIVKTFFLLLTSRTWHLSSEVTSGHFFQVGGTLHDKFQQ